MKVRLVMIIGALIANFALLAQEPIKPIPAKDFLDQVNKIIDRPKFNKPIISDPNKPLTNELENKPQNPAISNNQNNSQDFSNLNTGKLRRLIPESLLPENNYRKDSEFPKTQRDWEFCAHVYRIYLSLPDDARKDVFALMYLKEIRYGKLYLQQQGNE